MRSIRVLLVIAWVAAALLPVAALAHGGGQHGGGRHSGGAGFGHGMRTVPDITPQGRFVHGPSFGHPSFGHPSSVGRPHRGSRVFFAAPLIVPPYYGAPIYSTTFPADPYAIPPVTYDPPPVSYAPPPVTYTPPPVAYAPQPPVTATPSVPPARVATGPATPIYYCAELHAYTNDLKSMDCPGTWRRMSN